MNSVKKKFLDLLRSAIWQDDDSLNNSNCYDWDAILKLAKQQTVLPLIADNVLKYCHDGLSDNKKQYLKKLLYVNLMTNQRLNVVLLNVVGILKEKCVPYVLLKGQGLASNYTIPYLRTCGDIDLYVGESNVPKVIEILSPIIDPGSINLEPSYTKHDHIKINGIPIELHRRTADMPSRSMTRIYRGIEKELLSGSSKNYFDLNGKKICISEPTFDIFFVFYHIWQHFITSGVGIRQFCDMVYFLYRKKDLIDLNRLNYLLTELHLMKVWKTFMFILVNYLGLDEKFVPFYDDSRRKKAEAVLSIILEEGNFGHYKKHKTNITLRIRIIQKLRNLIFNTLRCLKLLLYFPKNILRYYMHYIFSGIYRLVVYK